MNLPENFSWMDENNIGEWPKMITEGVKLLGVKEIKGPENNPEIMKCAAELHVSDIYTSDDRMAWCALVQCAIARRAGHPVNYKDNYDYLRALSFLKQGIEFNKEEWLVIAINLAMFGDVLIVKRPEGGHDCMYIAESKTHFYVMGGNQNDQYGFTKIAKERIVGVRRPHYTTTPPSVKKYYMNDSGQMSEYESLM